MQVHGNWENQLLALAGYISQPIKRPYFSYWAGDASLREAYRQAERVTASHSKSFYLASGLLPEEKRCAVRALYAFCRTVDDIVDESRLAEREDRLGFWRRLVESGVYPDDDPLAAA